MFRYHLRDMGRTNKSFLNFSKKIKVYYSKDNIYRRRSLFSIKYREVTGKFPKKSDIQKQKIKCE